MSEGSEPSKTIKALLSRGSVPVSEPKRGVRARRAQELTPARPSRTRGGVGQDSVFSDRLRQPDYLAAARADLTPVRRRKTHGFAPLPRDRFAFIVCNRLTPKIAAGVAGKDI